MARDFQINGPCMVKVQGGQGTGIASLSDLGLTQGAINVIPSWEHKNIPADDFGGRVPPEVMWQLGEVTIEMDLIHFDEDILDACLIESMAGSPGPGTMAGAGTMMGNGLPVFSKGNHYIGMILTSPEQDFPWFFPACFLSDRPVRIPLGTEKSVVLCTWRSIPYVPWITPPATPGGDGGGMLDAVLGAESPDQPEILSQGAVLWATSTINK